jgi:hypothetical protein
MYQEVTSELTHVTFPYSAISDTNVVLIGCHRMARICTYINSVIQFSSHFDVLSSAVDGRRFEFCYCHVVYGWK